ncbi:hypothetical protein H310_01887 [Aphanomyces invadans]|uniref:Uncharacterized protein n=1 Tax=Aphanomyces invadans TaxID=157072 RepID=A0A024ULN3_9STRA|nr:hypothetical protein H310_01887 [Aphanomyces invadans]ETW07351.1 hypothetical protein H310_01887 [Aphanomyces invadans]|eukprot:XP_008863444.1 hypothetical protein H310_01887 [Aphanomyces invadans]
MPTTHGTSSHGKYRSKDNPRVYPRTSGAPSAPPSWSNQTHHGHRAKTSTIEDSQASKTRMEQLIAWRAARNKTAEDAVASNPEKQRLLDRQPASFKTPISTDGLTVSVQPAGDATHTRRLCHVVKATAVEEPPRPSSRHLRNFQFGPIEEKYVRQREDVDVEKVHEKTDVPTPQTPPQRRQLAIKLDFSSPAMDNDGHREDGLKHVVVPATFNPVASHSNRQAAFVKGTTSRSQQHIPVYQAHTIASLNHQRAMAERAAQRSAEQLQLQRHSRRPQLDETRGRMQRSKSQDSNHARGERSQRLQRSNSQPKTTRHIDAASVPPARTLPAFDDDLSIAEGIRHDVDNNSWNGGGDVDKGPPGADERPSDVDQGPDVKRRLHFETGDDQVVETCSPEDVAVASPEPVDQDDVVALLSKVAGTVETPEQVHDDMLRFEIHGQANLGKSAWIDNANMVETDGDPSGYQSPSHSPEQEDPNELINETNQWLWEGLEPAPEISTHLNVKPRDATTTWEPVSSPAVARHMDDGHDQHSTPLETHHENPSLCNVEHYPSHGDAYDCGARAAERQHDNFDTCPNMHPNHAKHGGGDDTWGLESTPSEGDDNLSTEDGLPEEDGGFEGDAASCSTQSVELDSPELQSENDLDPNNWVRGLPPLPPSPTGAPSPSVSQKSWSMANSPESSPVLTKHTSGIPSSRPEVPYALDMDLIHPSLPLCAASPASRQDSMPTIQVYESPTPSVDAKPTPPLLTTNPDNSQAQGRQPVRKLDVASSLQLRQRPARRSFLGMTPPRPLVTGVTMPPALSVQSAVQAIKPQAERHVPWPQDEPGTAFLTAKHEPRAIVQDGCSEALPPTSAQRSNDGWDDWPASPQNVAPADHVVFDVSRDVATPVRSPSKNGLALPQSSAAIYPANTAVDPMAEWAWEPDYESPPPSPQFVATGSVSCFPVVTRGEDATTCPLVQPRLSPAPVSNSPTANYSSPPSVAVPTLDSAAPPVDFAIPERSVQQGALGGRSEAAIASKSHHRLHELRDASRLGLPTSPPLHAVTPSVPPPLVDLADDVEDAEESQETHMSWLDIVLRGIVGVGCVALSVAALHVQLGQDLVVQSKLHQLVADVESLAAHAAAYDDRLASWGTSLTRELDATSHQLHQESSSMQADLEAILVTTKERNAMAMADVEVALASALEHFERVTETTVRARWTQEGLVQTGDATPAALPQFLLSVQHEIEIDQAALRALRQTQADLNAQAVQELNNVDVCAAIGDELCRLGIQAISDDNVGDDVDTWIEDHNRQVDAAESAFATTEMYLHSILLIELGVVVLLWVLWRLRHVDLGVDTDDIVFIPHMGRDDLSLLPKEHGASINDHDGFVEDVTTHVGDPKTPQVIRQLKFQPTPRSVRRSPRLETSVVRRGYLE